LLIGELDMVKRSVTAAPAEQNFIKAYFELKRLREDIACIERSANVPAGRRSAASRDISKGGDGMRDVSRP